jgi:hypothetical protein
VGAEGVLDNFEEDGTSLGFGPWARIPTAQTQITDSRAMEPKKDLSGDLIRNYFPALSSHPAKVLCRTRAESMPNVHSAQLKKAAEFKSGIAPYRTANTCTPHSAQSQ